MTVTDPHEILERARAAHVEVVQLQFTDVTGAIKSVTLPAARLERCLEEWIWFDGSAIEGTVRSAESDLFLRADATTFAILPAERTPTARLVCDLVLPDGGPCTADPRAALKAALADAAELGFRYRVSAELEFFLFDVSSDGPGLVPVDSSGYFEVPSDRAASLCWEAAQMAEGLGGRVDGTHHEVAPGQHEIDLGETDALLLADVLVGLKWGMRSLGRRVGLQVSFMPKPLEHASGSGLHISQMLENALTGADAFFAPDEPYDLSVVGGQFVAGQLAHARGMCAVLAPVVNSYKRLLGGAEAPARVCWARVNRGALIRVPENAGREGTRLELRGPDPSCNPYLALTVMLRAGLDGVRSELPLPAPADESFGLGGDGGTAADPLPCTLGEALEELSWDPVVREALGEPIYERLLAAKEREWGDYEQHISQWELDHYLENA